MSHLTNEYERGDAVRCRAEFANLTGTPIDPTTVSVSVLKPNGTKTTKIFGTDAEVVKEAAGKYYIDVNADTAGKWYYRFESTGTGQAADEQRFDVKPSKFN